MHEARELLRSLEVLERDAVAIVRKFSESLLDCEHFSEADYQLREGFRLDEWASELGQVMRSVYDEHARYYRKTNNLE